jgi:hypothetical protein
MKNIVSRCNGKIIIIDTGAFFDRLVSACLSARLGISHAYGGVLSALSIEYTLTPTTEHQKWIEKEVVSAVYVDRTDVIAIDERVIVGDFGAW